mmetsp:Transcript_131074/g.195337  ORF Transcript_131074/g.195337 Transcript_131074/m.195337 type:complete len:266 (-) Transcript_131074:106-903(-)
MNRRQKGTARSHRRSAAILFFSSSYAGHESIYRRQDPCEQRGAARMGLVARKHAPTVLPAVLKGVKLTNSTGAKPHSIMYCTYTCACTVPATHSAQLPPPSPPQLELGSRIMSPRAKIPPGLSMSKAFLKACFLSLQRLKTPLLITMSTDPGFMPTSFSSNIGSSALSTRACNTLARASSIWQMLTTSLAFETIASVKSTPTHVAPDLAITHKSKPAPHPRSSTRHSDPTVALGAPVRLGTNPTGHAAVHASSGSELVSYPIFLQ